MISFVFKYYCCVLAQKMRKNYHLTVISFFKTIVFRLIFWQYDSFYYLCKNFGNHILFSIMKSTLNTNYIGMKFKRKLHK